VKATRLNIRFYNLLFHTHWLAILVLAPVLPTLEVASKTPPSLEDSTRLSRELPRLPLSKTRTKTPETKPETNTGLLGLFKSESKTDYFVHRVRMRSGLKSEDNSPLAKVPAAHILVPTKKSKKVGGKLSYKFEVLALPDDTTDPHGCARRACGFFQDHNEFLAASVCKTDPRYRKDSEPNPKIQSSSEHHTPKYHMISTMIKAGLSIDEIEQRFGDVNQTQMLRKCLRSCGSDSSVARKCQSELPPTIDANADQLEYVGKGDSKIASLETGLKGGNVAFNEVGYPSSANRGKALEETPREELLTKLTGQCIAPQDLECLKKVLAQRKIPKPPIKEKKSEPPNDLLKRKRKRIPRAVASLNKNAYQDPLANLLTCHGKPLPHYAETLDDILGKMGIAHLLDEYTHFSKQPSTDKLMSAQYERLYKIAWAMKTFYVLASEGLANEASASVDKQLKNNTGIDLKELYDIDAVTRTIWAESRDCQVQSDGAGRNVFHPGQGQIVARVIAERAYFAKKEPSFRANPASHQANGDTFELFGNYQRSDFTAHKYSTLNEKDFQYQISELLCDGPSCVAVEGKQFQPWSEERNKKGNLSENYKRTLCPIQPQRDRGDVFKRNQLAYRNSLKLATELVLGGEDFLRRNPWILGNPEEVEKGQYKSLAVLDPRVAGPFFQHCKANRCYNLSSNLSKENPKCKVVGVGGDIVDADESKGACLPIHVYFERSLAPQIKCPTPK